MKLKDHILNVLTFIEKKAKTTRTELVAKDECLKKLDISKAALLLIIHTAENCTSPSEHTVLLKRIALDALQQIK